MSSEEHGAVLITGASSGIGRAATLYLAERGYHVVGTSRSMERLEGLLEEARRRHLPVSGAELDINSDGAVERVVPELASRHGGIGVLVNNAGYGLWGPIGSLSTRELAAQFETNVFAVHRLIRAALPDMLEQRRGTIVNVSSVLGRIATPFKRRVRVKQVCPGGTERVAENGALALWRAGGRGGAGAVQDRVHQQPGHSRKRRRRRLGLCPLRPAVQAAQPGHAQKGRRPCEGGPGHTQDHTLKASRIPISGKRRGAPGRTGRTAAAREAVPVPDGPVYYEIGLGAGR